MLLTRLRTRTDPCSEAEDAIGTSLIDAADMSASGVLVALTCSRVSSTYSSVLSCAGGRGPLRRTLLGSPPTAHQKSRGFAASIHGYVHRIKITLEPVSLRFLGLPDAYPAIQSIHPSTTDRSECTNDVILTQPQGRGFDTGARRPPEMRAIATTAPFQAINDWPWQAPMRER